jgi:hypothetical protein
MRPVQAGIIIMTLITALFHLYLSTQPVGELRIWFLLNFIGYMVLLVALYWLEDDRLRLFVERRYIRYALMAYALLTIICWLILARPYNPNDLPIKFVEILLICLLLVEDRQAHIQERNGNLPYQQSTGVRNQR